MKKINLPGGLIRYDTEKNKSRRLRNEQEKKSFLRGRIYSYLLILIILSATIFYTLLNRSILELNVLHDRNPLFVKLSNGQIRNSYDIKILNKSFKNKNYSLTVEGLENSKIKIQGIQRYGLENMFNWKIIGKPQLAKPSYEIEDNYDWLETNYKLHLEKNMQSDTIISIASV